MSQHQSIIATVSLLLLGLSTVVEAADVEKKTMKAMHSAVATGLRDPHAASDGYTYATVPHPHEADEMNFSSLLADRFEFVQGRRDNAAAYDLQAWYGLDYDRLVVKAEGDVDAGRLQESRTELLWGHAIATFWDTQLGVRYDSGVDPGQGWLALGVEGLAPYWFDVESTVYLSSAGQAALRLDVSYELLFTQRWVLQPRIEATVYSKGDLKRSRGAGLSDLTTGLRLRYEIRRELAPYVGLEWAGLFGGTARYARAEGIDTKDMRAVMGLRFWF